MTDDVPVELFLDAYPPAIRTLAIELRSIVHGAAPTLIERVRGGWALIGYDLPVDRRRRRYLAFIAPETEHVHLGFEVGALMRPRPELAGAHLHLRKVRFLTYRAGDAIDRRLVVDLLREAIEIGSMSSGERDALAAHIADGAETRALAPANNGADALRARRGRRGDMRSGGSTGARILG